jgi:hypothetical protein
MDDGNRVRIKNIRVRNAIIKRRQERKKLSDRKKIRSIKNYVVEITNRIIVGSST